MNALSKFTVVTAVAVGAVLGVRYLTPGVCSALGMPQESFRDLARRAEEIERHSRQLEQEAGAAYERVRLKFQATGEFLDGRLSFLEAACRFKELNRDLPPRIWCYYRNKMECTTIDEFHCRQLVDYSRNELRSHPQSEERLRQAVARLDDLLRINSLHLDAAMTARP